MKFGAKKNPTVLAGGSRFAPNFIQNLYTVLKNPMNQKMVAGFGYFRACRFRKRLNENRLWLLPLPTFFKTWFLLHKMWLKLAKIDQKLIFSIFLKKSHF
jgi:hypothetical protein